MWQAWDLSLDLCLSQLPAVLECEDNYRHSPFFEEQLTAFQVWLDMGSDQRNPPEQLPIVLQVRAIITMHVVSQKGYYTMVSVAGFTQSSAQTQSFRVAQ